MALKSGEIQKTSSSYLFFFVSTNEINSFDGLKKFTYKF